MTMFNTIRLDPVSTIAVQPPSQPTVSSPTFEKNYAGWPLMSEKYVANIATHVANVAINVPTDEATDVGNMLQLMYM